MTLTNPLSQRDEAPLYRPGEAADYLTEGGRVAYVAPSSPEWGRKFIQRLDREGDYRFLVGTWEGEMWLLFGLEDQDWAEQVADEMGLDVTDAGPIAYYEDDDKRLFPLQPTEGIYAVSKTRRPDSEGSEED